jgi:hypothetical protein
MAKIKWTKPTHTSKDRPYNGQNKMDKALHRHLRIEQHEATITHIRNRDKAFKCCVLSYKKTNRKKTLRWFRKNFFRHISNVEFLIYILNI